MKKQLLIAAVAATMGTAAMADVSISGQAKVNYTNTDSTTESSDTNIFKHEVDVNVAGKSGDTSVVFQMTNTSSTNTNAETASVEIVESSVSTKIGDVSIKMGQFQSTSDSMLSDATNDTIAAGRFQASTTIAGVTLKYVDQNTSGEAVIISGEVSGVAISHKMGNGGANGTDDYTDTVVSGSVGGVSLKYRSKDYSDVDASDLSDMTSFEATGSLGGATVTYAMADAAHASDTFSTDGVLGTYGSINNVSGVKIASSLAGNAVALTIASTELTDGATSNDYTKVVITRPLASGATFEATYTDADMATGVDTKTLDLELAVKF
ncbi:hypothetical protein MNB_SUP05-9-346 [hydrothermal vent metagenome]|uniref:Porin domain-containing protein n=1 Tax=hydrothermal vent metagenome TaxID=652676 RepID=A0A1W1DRS4_9ZZZZ